jgi:hypothetical protein
MIDGHLFAASLKGHIPARTLDPMREGSPELCAYARVLECDAIIGDHDAVAA